MSIQIYEDYWEITNAFTNYNGSKFLTTLKICIDFIDEFKHEKQSEEKYKRLQQKLHKKLPKNLASIRKSINQLVKMGFINSFLTSYNLEAIEYLDAKTNRKRQSILSRIVYSYSSFSRSYEKKSDFNHVNFILKTLTEVGYLSKEDIKGLLIVDINNHKTIGYLSRSEIDNYVKLANDGAFEERKKNQISYLWNLLKKLDDLVIVNSKLYFEDDAKVIFGEELQKTSKKRDAYLHRLYKNQLKEESLELFGKTKCMLEQLTYPVLIASHIKPFILSTEDEAYDPNNGLLLSRTIDSLFDLKYISFNDNGTIIFTNRVEDDVIDFWKDYILDSRVLTKERLNYLKFHRQMVGV